MRDRLSAREACISALKSSIQALDSSIGSLGGPSRFWETFGWCCAVLVGIGVAGELVAIFHVFLDDKKNWRRGIVQPPDRPSKGWLSFEVVSTVLVVVGVFLEAGASAKVSSINSLLRSKTNELSAKSDQLLAVVTQEVGEATKKAGDAGSSAMSASIAATDAQHAASIAKRDTEAVSTKAKEIRADLEALRREMSARFITDNVGLKKDLEKSLKGRSILFVSYARDAESLEYCLELTGIAQWAGLDSKNACAQRPMPPIPSFSFSITAASAKEAELLGRIFWGKPGRVSGADKLIAEGGGGPQIIVFVGARTIPLKLWQKAPKK